MTDSRPLKYIRDGEWPRPRCLPVEWLQEQPKRGRRPVWWVATLELDGGNVFHGAGDSHDEAIANLEQLVVFHYAIAEEGVATA